MTAQILVVDDEPDMKALVLQKFRHQIGDGAINFLFASDGIEALAMLEANSDIDMVVADINMPRMDGLTLLQKLQERRNTSPGSAPTSHITVLSWSRWMRRSLDEEVTPSSSRRRTAWSRSN